MHTYNLLQKHRDDFKLVPEQLGFSRIWQSVKPNFRCCRTPGLP